MCDVCRRTLGIASLALPSRASFLLMLLAVRHHLATAVAWMNCASLACRVLDPSWARTSPRMLEPGVHWQHAGQSTNRVPDSVHALADVDLPAPMRSRF